MSKLYAAYGSNLNKGQMAFRCPDALPVAKGKILDHELVFRRGFLTIEPKAGAYVQTGIWEISDDDEKSLDRYEGYPNFYHKQTIKVDCGDGEFLDCLVYIMNDGYEIQQPAGFYASTVNSGYTDFEFDKGPLLVALYNAMWGTDYQADYH